MSETEDVVDLIDSFDNHASLRAGLARVAEHREDWAGIPMPLADQTLVVEPKYPNAKELMEFHRKEGDVDEKPLAIRSAFWSTFRRCTVVIYEKDGKVEWGYKNGVHHLTEEIQTLGASVAWGIVQEAKAMQLLAGLLPAHAFKKYLLTGAFLESSPRSGVTYLFRRLRPTVAVKEHAGQMRILAALCLHPIAYYAGSWAGAMCPTDDVVAHLILMRGNEALFWKRANQHPAWRPEAGI